MSGFLTVCNVPTKSKGYGIKCFIFPCGPCLFRLLAGCWWILAKKTVSYIYCSLQLQCQNIIFYSLVELFIQVAEVKRKTMCLSALFYDQGFSAAFHLFLLNLLLCLDDIFSRFVTKLGCFNTGFVLHLHTGG